MTIVHGYNLDEISDSAEDIDRRVLMGIDILDRFGPADWRDRIDWGMLAMSDPCGCVIGQVNGIESGAYMGVWEQFKTATARLGISNYTEFFGFETFGLGEDTYFALAEAWRRLTGNATVWK